MQIGLKPVRTFLSLRLVLFKLLKTRSFITSMMATSIAMMSLCQGVVAISGNGWMKWGYVHVADLDPLDREYNEAYEKEAAAES